jgi:CRP/FNR family transcriptional regulator, cyclic AMP receptor protein
MKLDLSARRAAVDNSQLFKALKTAELDAILSRATMRRVPRGSVIVRRGDPTEGLAVILTGRVRISVTSETGKEVTLAVLGAHDMLGEISMLDGDACSADATALEDCVLLTLERNRFIELLHSNAALCQQLMVVLCRRLRHSNATLEDMTSLDLPTRLAKLLLHLVRDCGTRTENGVRIGLKLSQTDLATLIGASRAKVNRQLRKWEGDGILRTERGRLMIVRPDALRSSG